MKQLIGFVTIFVIIALAITLFNVATSIHTPKAHGLTARINNLHLDLSVANTDALRVKGLSGVDKLKSNEGMLFIFPKEGNYGFWMKDMNFPIDIIWIDRDLKVAGVAKNVLPSTYPQAFYPPTPVPYVLELPAGTFDANGLKVTDLLILESQNNAS